MIAMRQLFAICLFATLTQSSISNAQEITRVNVGPGGVEANGLTSAGDISADGRWIVFDSAASNLVTDDTNSLTDVFVYDAMDGTVTRVSVASNGDEGNGHSYSPRISEDGRYVAFFSQATNFAATPDGFFIDVYVHDRNTGQTILASADTNGNRAADGRAYLRDFSGNGRHVAFEADFDDASIDSTPGKRDAWVRNLDTNEITLLDQSSQGDVANDDVDVLVLNFDGSLAAFATPADNLVANDDNFLSDIFVRNTILETTQRVSLTNAGEQLETGITSVSNSTVVDGWSEDNRYLAMGLSAGELLDPPSEVASQRVFRRDLQTNQNALISVGPNGPANDASLPTGISGDGDLVSFFSLANNLSPEDTDAEYDMYVRRVSEGRTILITRAWDGGAANGNSYFGTIAKNGEYMVFISDADNLVEGDTNGELDIFLATIPPKDTIFADSYE